VERRPREVPAGDQYPPVFLREEEPEPEEESVTGTPFNRQNNLRRRHIGPYDPVTEAAPLRSCVARKMAVVMQNLHYLAHFCYVPSTLIFADGARGKFSNFPPVTYSDAATTELLQQVLATRARSQAGRGGPRTEITHRAIAASLTQAHSGMNVMQPFIMLQQTLKSLNNVVSTALGIRCSNQQST
jgi:hypothetical protein